MGIFISLVKKEALHITRDRRTMFITLLMPLVLLLLFGFAISTEVNNVRVVAVADRHDDVTRGILSRLGANGYFSFLGVAAPARADEMLRRGEADAALYFRAEGTAASVQVAVDATNPVVARSAAMYLENLVAAAGTAPPSPVIVTTLYNPQLRSAYNFVPGIMGMIFILICAIMTSVSIVSKKERGTMDLLLVSPARPRFIILGKLVPYFLLSCVILAVMLLMAYTVLALPVSSTIASVVAVSLLYIVLSLGIGMLVSTLVSDQVSALLVSAVLFMLPVILLSGMIYPVDNMPLPLRWFSAIIPARWYIAAMRQLMIQQVPLSMVAAEVGTLAAMAVVILGAAVLKFRISADK